MHPLPTKPRRPPDRRPRNALIKRSQDGNGELVLGLATSLDELATSLRHQPIPPGGSRPHHRQTSVQVGVGERLNGLADRSRAIFPARHLLLGENLATDGAARRILARKWN
jgi:hypothetical protein